MKAFLCTNIEYDDGFPDTESVVVILKDDLTPKEWEAISKEEIFERLASLIDHNNVVRFDYKPIPCFFGQLSPRAI